MDEGVSKVGQDYARLIERLRVSWSDRGWVASKKITGLLADANESAEAIEQLLADNERMIQLLDSIAEITGPEGPESYRGSDPEACFDAIHATARAALNPIQTTGDHHAR